MAFHQIAIPHRDILSENFSSEVYAAKLWDVYTKRGLGEYTDAKNFFEKTYLTDNLKKILDSVKNRLDRKGGGHFRSITTPFGGGKTHTLIALYHKCTEWGVKPVVLVGNELDVQTQTLWGMIEEQLTGKIDRLKGQVPRGGEALRNVLEEQEKPILILIDELLQYVTRAEAVKVNDTTLASLTIAFVQELSEAVSSLDNVCVVVTLPSSTNEQLDDERFAMLYEKLRKVAGRTMDTISPVSDMDIPKIIRQRLFSSTDAEIRERAEGVVKDFVDYCEDENLIPEGKQKSEYREEFLNSYPFLPHVIDVLYHRWGTIQQFQRTRGVLRLLSLVVGSLANSDKQFISLGDFDLSNDTIRQELIEYLDPQFNGAVAKDIVGEGSGASKVNQKVPDQYRGKQLGIRAATTIFMYSHSGGAEINGATEVEIKRATCERGIPAAQISGILNLFRNHLFYLSVTNDRYFFTKETNILKHKVDVMENLNRCDTDEAEEYLVKKNMDRVEEIRVFLWPDDPMDVDDSIQLKLIVMKEDDQDMIRRIYDKVGESDRTYRNNIFFLTPTNGERERFMKSLRSKVAWERIKSDPHINLTKEQASTLANELRNESERLASLVKDYYSVLYTPEKEGPEPSRVRPPLGTDSGIDRIVYDHLVEKEAVNSEIGSMTLKIRYLNEKKTVETSNLLKSMLSVPGELRPTGRNVLEHAIIDGVINGEFGLGEIEDGALTVKFFKKQASVSFELGEVLVHKSICNDVQEPREYLCPICDYKTNDGENLEIHKKKIHAQKPPEDDPPPPGFQDRIRLEFWFDVPEGKVNQIGDMLLNIASHYKNFRIHIDASNGKMSKNDIDMIRETLKQIGAKFDLQ